MKYFQLANKKHKETVDLRIFEDEITKAVMAVNNSVTVTVGKNYYTTTPTLTKRESIKVSTILRQGSLFDYTVYRPCLFLSVEELPKTKEEINEEEQPCQKKRTKKQKNG